MKFNKVTTGFVIQTFDTDLKGYVSQSFVAGDVTYETLKGAELSNKVIESLGDKGFGPMSEVEPYLPFDMVQPNVPSPEITKSDLKSLQDLQDQVIDNLLGWTDKNNMWAAAESEIQGIVENIFKKYISTKK